MNIIGIIIAALIVGMIGLIIGLLLGAAGEKFKIEVDEKELKIRGILPGNNCGGCGFPGCDGLAKAIAQGEADVNACPVGGDTVAKVIGEIMGKAGGGMEKMVAFVKCAGTSDKTKTKYNYYGSKDCKKASIAPGGGEKKCTFGCMGYGTCVKACMFDAIHVIDGIAVVDREKCAACKQCVLACPKNLIELVPYKAEHLIQCNSQDKGKQVKEGCVTGCIGCTLCVKECEFDAIQFKDNLAHIDYNKCTNCGKCAIKCPVKVIV